MQPGTSECNPILNLSEKIFKATGTNSAAFNINDYWPAPNHFWIGQNRFSPDWCSTFPADVLSLPNPVSETCLNQCLTFLNEHGKIQRAKAYIIAEICFQIIKNQSHYKYYYRFGDILASRSLGAGINERAVSCLAEIQLKNLNDAGLPEADIENFEIKKLSMLAKAHRNLGNYDLANQFYQQSLARATSTQNEFQIANQTYQLGKMYCNYLKQPERGIFQYKQALAVFCDLNAQKMQAACLDDLGDSYRHHLRDYDQAEKFFRQALKINQQIKNTGSQSRNLAHLGLIAENRGDRKTADRLLTQSLDLLLSNPAERRGLGVRYAQMGELKMLFGDFDAGEALITESLLINREFNDRLTATKNLLKLADLYSRRKDLQTAISILTYTITLCQNENSTSAYYRYPEQAKDCCYQLGNLHYEAGNYEAARLHFIYGNSLLNHIWDDFLNAQISRQKEMSDTDTVRMYQALLKQYNSESHENTNNINRILEKYHQKIIGLTRPNLRKELEAKYDIREVTSNSEVLLKQLKYGLRAAKSNEPILLLGETGAGKEVFAKAIHLNSGRICPNRTLENSFAPINCGAIPPDLVESELFGHKKGAFTSADRNKTGIFEEYSGGTVFLDEVADLPLSAQVKLLRFLQHKEIRPVGSTETKIVDVRIIAATNKNLEAEIENHRFREDLYYRLNVIPVTVPSLRERPEDIDLLIDHILEDKLALAKPDRPEFSQQAIERLKNHHWRGNVRELENLLIRCIKIIDEDQHISEDDIIRAFELSANHTTHSNDNPFNSVTEQTFGPVKIAVASIPDTGIEIQLVLKAIAEYLIQLVAEKTNWHSLIQISELAHLNYEKTKRILRRKSKTVQIKDITIT